MSVVVIQFLGILDLTFGTSYCLLALPLTQLDLSNFSFVTDDAILSLAAAKNLQSLSLARTRLTDSGSAVFVHLSSLKELLLDQTSIGDKSMEYLRGNHVFLR